VGSCGGGEHGAVWDAWILEQAAAKSKENAKTIAAAAKTAGADDSEEASVGVDHAVAARGNTIAAGQFCFEKNECSS
jgi:hypothetical protein